MAVIQPSQAASAHGRHRLGETRRFDNARRGAFEILRAEKARHARHPADREIVRIGEPEAVAAWRLEWAQRGVELLRELGLEASLENASDPFFGRTGRLLAANQSAERLKVELLVPIAGPEPTADR